MRWIKSHCKVIKSCCNVQWNDGVLCIWFSHTRGAGVVGEAASILLSEVGPGARIEEETGLSVHPGWNSGSFPVGNKGGSMALAVQSPTEPGSSHQAGVRPASRQRRPLPASHYFYRRLWISRIPESSETWGSYLPESIISEGEHVKPGVLLS